MNAIEVKHLVRSFQNGSVTQTVLRGISLKIEKGEFVAIMGKSGAGKSTLLYQISLLDRPSEGEILIDGVDTHVLSDRERTAFRLNELGYIFQDYALLPELSSTENVLVPLLMQGLSMKEAVNSAHHALDSVGLGKRYDNLPSQLSGGEQQRVAIARAIAHNPKILFADEPTANLDTETSKVVLDVLLSLNKKGQTIVMVTHERDYGALANRIITLSDGTIVDVKKHHDDA